MWVAHAPRADFHFLFYERIGVCGAELGLSGFLGGAVMQSRALLEKCYFVQAGDNGNDIYRAL